MIGYFDAVIDKYSIPLSTLTDAQVAAIGAQYGGYVDSARGKYVQTHGYIAAYAGEAVGDDWISSTGELTTGAQVVYRLATPVEYDIDALPDISAGDGATSVFTNNGSIEITGATDLRWEIEKLKNAIEALGGTV